MIAELSWLKNSAIVPSGAVTSYFDYRRNFVFSPFTLGNTNSWLANMLALATLSMAFAPLVMLCSPYRKKLNRRLKIVLALFAFSLLMATHLTPPLSPLLPNPHQLPFPF